MTDSDTYRDAAIGVNMLLGLWIAFSPYLLRFRSVLPADWSNVAIGFLIAVLSGFRISVGYRQPLWSWCTALLGVWVMVSPFALGFSNVSIALWDNLVVGAVVALLSWKATKTFGNDPIQGRSAVG